MENKIISNPGLTSTNLTKIDALEKKEKSSQKSSINDSYSKKTIDILNTNKVYKNVDPKLMDKLLEYRNIYTNLLEDKDIKYYLSLNEITNEEREKISKIIDRLQNLIYDIEADHQISTSLWVRDFRNTVTAELILKHYKYSFFFLIGATIIGLAVGFITKSILSGGLSGLTLAGIPYIKKSMDTGNEYNSKIKNNYELLEKIDNEKAKIISLAQQYINNLKKKISQ